ncbi:MAG: FAD-dependent oxidoreductase, partial [Firmicutes bacterium]|nr:FAD-dependent oxidoreductase [Bacillota bacterium]
MKTLELKKNFFWTGVLDPDLDVFDIIMHTEFGTTYNSYMIKGSEKTAIFETAKAKFLDQYIESLESLTDIKDIDYIIVNHTEPDHAGSAAKLIEMNPGIKLVGTGTAIRFIKEITNTDFVSITVKNGDTLSLGDKTLRFITAPNLHWPDTMYTYVEEDKTLVTCDSFGSHYSFDGILHSKITDEEGYMRALKYYFDNILGPFKSYLLAGINKIKDLDIDMICPGHGPVLDDDPWKIVEICKQWSTEVNPNPKKTVVVPYVSAYGYTETLADKITEGIRAAGDLDVKLYDMVYADEAEVRGELYWADGILFGTPTILGEALEPIWDLTIGMFAGTHGGKIASAFGSYGWSGEGVPHIVERLRQLKMKIYGEGLRVKFKPSDAQLQEAYEFGYNFGLSVIEGKIVEPEPAPAANQKWKCLVCGEIIEGPKPPESCPVCGVGPEQFVAVEEKEIGFVSQSTDNIVIIGGGIAGLSAADAIRKRNELAQVEIISNEPVFCYNRPQLTKGLLSEFDAISFFNKQLEWYQENKIRLTLDTEVTSIDTEAKTLSLANGEERKYDRLIIASGAECNMPPTPGNDKKGVYVIRKLADAN